MVRLIGYLSHKMHVHTCKIPNRFSPNMKRRSPSNIEYVPAQPLEIFGYVDQQGMYRKNFIGTISESILKASVS